MRPVSLRLSGFRSFRAEQTIDFSGLGLFAIVGDTGSGKSSILEAIVYALFNATTWNERDVKTLIALDATTMRVDFAFAVDDRTYRVTRSASSVARPPIHSLRCDELPDFRADGEATVKTELQRLLGLDYSTFTKTVVLPQGRFADLLTAKPADRTRALTELLGLDEIDRIRETLEIPRERFRTMCATLRAKRDQLGQDPRETVRLLGEDVRVSSLRAATLAEAQHTIESSQRTQLEGERNLRELTMLRGAHERFHGATARILGLMNRDAELRAQLEEAKTHVAAARAAVAEARSASDALADRGMTLATLALARTNLTRMAAERDRLAAECEEIAEREAALCVAASQVEQRSEALNVATELCDAAIVDAEAAESTARQARDAERVHREAWSAATSAQAAQASRRHAESTAARACERASGAHAIARTTYDAAMAACARVARRLDEARHTHRVATLSIGLAAGAPCPVCERTLPATFEPPRIQALDDAMNKSRAMEAAAQAARRGLEDEDRNKARAEAELHAAQRESAAANKAATAAAARLVALDVASNAATIEAATAVSCERRRSAEAVAVSQRDRATGLQTDVAADKTGLAVASTQLTNDRGRLAKDRERLLEATIRLHADREALSPDLRPSAALTDAEIAAALEVTERFERDARAMETAVQKADVARRDTERRVESLRASRRSEVEAVIVERLADLAREIAAARLTMYGEVPGYSINESLTRIFGWAATMATRAAAVIERLEADHAALEGARVEAERTIAGMLDREGLETIEALSRQFAEASQRHAALDERRRAAAAAAADADELDAELAAAEPLATALDRLRGYLLNGGFKAYVMRRRERRLLGVATETLRAMTGQRYAFAEGFSILDGQTGQTRAAATLSGGEKFLASLALALGLVELTSLAGGRLDALFLDEGFGSLDTTALDAALAELARRAGGRKLIGVITHVRSMASEIDDVLRVRRLPGGSEVERLDAAERERFFDDAMAAGLLEAITG